MYSNRVDSVRPKLRHFAMQLRAVGYARRYVL